MDIILILIFVGIMSQLTKQTAKKPKPGNPQQPVQPQRPTVQRPTQARPVQMPVQPRPAVHEVPKPAQPTLERSENMTPEPMVPERMEPTVLKTELSEGMGDAEGRSFRDADGCLGGSMAHDESVHQGRELHEDEHMHQAVMPMHHETEVQPERPTVTAEQLRSAVIWAEILDRPVALRD